MSVSLVNAAGETVDVTADVTLEYDSPAALFAARNTAYVAENLKATYTAENGEVYEITGPMVYIGKKGDANLDGRVDITDAVLLNKIVAGSVSANTQQRLNGDCNGDGALDSGDGILLLQFLVHIIQSIGPSAK